MSNNKTLEMEAVIQEALDEFEKQLKYAKNRYDPESDYWQGVTEAYEDSLDTLKQLAIKYDIPIVTAEQKKSNLQEIIVETKNRKAK